MFGGAFDAGREPEQFGLIHAARGHDGRDFGLAFGECAGLVEDERIGLFQSFERLGILDQDAAFSPFADADHDRHGCREAKGAGTGNDEDRDAGEEGEGEAGFRTHQHPAGKRNGGNRDD